MSTPKVFALNLFLTPVEGKENLYILTVNIEVHGKEAQEDKVVFFDGCAENLMLLDRQIDQMCKELCQVILQNGVIL